MSAETHSAAADTLAGRVAVVTGAGRGIGAAIAAELAGLGAAVALLGRDAGRLAAHAATLRAQHGTNVATAVCDVTDDDAVQRAFAYVRAALGEPYILVNNAGQAEGSPFTDTTRELWDRMIAVNLTGVFVCTREVVPAMRSAGDGRIVNIASTSGLRGYRNVTAYSAAKHGVVGFTRALAAETARDGITVNAVCPGYVDTDMTQRAIATVMRDLDSTEDQARARIARTNPRGTLIRPAEVAATVAWLCTPAASAVSGQTIAVAGGQI